MSDQNASPPPGPDLEVGIPWSDLNEGTPVLGHVGDEAVLLTRSGESLFAIGATCTHYGGPLAEGLIEGEAVRCPWHHACFSLRTGEALDAPALSAVSCWTVIRDGDRVRVSGRREAAARPRPRATPSSVVIVGAGAAGHACAEMLRREGFEGPVHLLSEDSSPPCDRPNLSKDFLAGNAPEDWIPLRPPDFFAEKHIELRTTTRVQRIDPAARQVHLASGESLAYGALVLATGASPVRLPLKGFDLPHVFTLRTLSDCRAIISAAQPGKKAVVIGASFIGLEVAASLRTRGLEVTAVAPESLPLERVMGKELGRFVQDVHESHGVRFRLGARPSEIDATHVTLEDGTQLEADLVVAGVGVRPNLSLAEAAGLKIDRGVAVNERLETSAPGIWAVGDIARWPDVHTGSAIRVEHWVVAERQGQMAARNVLGANLPYRDVPFFWSAHYDQIISYVGHAEGWDRIDLDGNLANGAAEARFMKGNRALAVATVGRDLDSLRAEAEMRRTAAA